MTLMVCPYCLEPCGPQGDGCADKGLPIRSTEEIEAACERHSWLYSAPPFLPSNPDARTQ